jgi:hypothetical protein
MAQNPLMHMEYVNFCQMLKSLEEVIWIDLILAETKLHILLVKWKLLMLQILFIIVKRQVLHLNHDLLCVSLASEGETQIRWAIAIKWKM